MAKLKQFALDSLSNYFNMFMKIGIYFISVPICLDVYGKELYGVFLLTFGLANSFMFFDFGIANSLIRYASAFKRTKDIKQFSEEVSFSISTLFYSIVLTSFIFLSLAFFGFKVFKIPEEYVQMSSDLFLVSAFYIVTIFSFNFTKFFLNGLGHFFLRNLLQTLNIVISLVNVGLIYFFEIGIVWFAILSMLPNIVGILIDLYYLNKKEKSLVKSLDIKLNLRWSYVLKSKYSKFNLNIFKNSLIGFFSREIDKPLISFFLGTGLLVGFSILIRPFGIIKGLIANVFFVVQQKLQQNLDNLERLRSMVIIFTRTNFMLVFGAVIIIYISYPGFVKLWLPNEDFIYYADWAFLGAVNLLIAGFYKAQYSLLSLSDDNIKTVKLSLISVGINLVVSVVLIQSIGVISVIIGTTVQSIYNLGYFYLYSKRKLKISFTDYFNLKYMTIGLVILVPAVILRRQSFFIEETWIYYLLKVGIICAPLALIIAIGFKKELKELKSL